LLVISQRFGERCECEICKKWDRVLCGECTLKKFREMQERIVRVEEAISNVKGQLLKIEELIRGKQS